MTLTHEEFVDRLDQLVQENIALGNQVDTLRRRLHQIFALVESLADLVTFAETDPRTRAQ